MSMIIISVFFCAGTVFTNLLIQSQYANRWLNANQSFQACPKIALLLICSSICNQIASVVASRPTEIFYDPGYILMIAIQLGGFFLCLIFAYILGARSILLQLV